MRITALLIVTLALTGCERPTDTPFASPEATPIVATVPSPPEIQDTVMPDKAGTKPAFAESIDERTKAAGIGRLRTAIIAQDDVELRIWAGFGKMPLEGYLFKRQEGTWSGQRMFSDSVHGKFTDRSVPLQEPNNGWEAFWRALKSHRVLSLPDAELINCHERMLDGFSFVVEIRKGRDYRTYRYENSDNLCPEASDMSAIYQQILADFNLRGGK